MAYLVIFFIRNGIHNRRIIWMSVLGLVPVGFALLLLVAQPLLDDANMSLSLIYPQFSMLLFLHFLLPLLSVFMGTAIIGDEVEEKTLPYLLTRPVPRWKIITAKTLASVLTTGAVILVSLGLVYVILMSSGGSWRFVRGLTSLLSSYAAIGLGLAVYLPLFGFFGGILKKPVLAGLLFSFGWENSVAFFPGNARFVTVAHYLHSIFPTVKRVDPQNFGASFFGLALSAQKAPLALAILVLVLFSALFTTLMISLLYFREYRLEQGD